MRRLPIRSDQWWCGVQPADDREPCDRTAVLQVTAQAVPAVPGNWQYASVHIPVCEDHSVGLPTKLVTR